MLNTQYIKIDMIPSGVMPVLYCSQYDVGRPLGLVVYNGSESVNLSEYTVTIEGTRTDKTPVTAGVDTNDNIGVFTTTPTMTNEADSFRMKLVLSDGDGNRVASIPFVLRVDPKTMDENAEQIEEDASLYQQYTATVQTIIASIRADLAAEITARQNAISTEASTRAAAVSAEAASRQSADNTLQSNINAEASTRATQDASLQSQIDQLIAPSGEAPSAAEVENARIGSDGTVYPTLGDAIRTQNSLLKSHLEAALTDIGVEGGTSEVALTVTWGQYIDSDGSIASVSGNYGTCRGAVTAGTTYYISASSNYNKPYYAWYDSSMNLVRIGSLSVAGSAVTSIINERAIAPTGATYIVVVQNTNGNTAKVTGEAYSFPTLDNAVSEIDDLDSALTTLTEKLGGYVESIKPVSLTNTYGYYINSNGVITSTSGNYGIKRGNVTAGEKYYVTASSNFANPFYAWYDASDNLIQLGQASAAGSTYTSITDAEVIAPIGAEKIVINWNTSSVEAALKIEEKKLAGKWYGKKWACVGNSLTDDNQYTTKHYFDYVADATDITPINMGDSGTGYKRGEDTDRAFYQRILSIDTSADVVTIFGSFNDIGAGYTLGTYTDTGTTTIAGCINTTIDNLQSVMPTVVLGIVAPTPWATARPDFHTNADNYVNMLQKIAEHRSIPFLDLYRASNLRPWDADFRALCYSNDGGNGVHPNDLGHKIIAPKFNAFLESLII